MNNFLRPFLLLLALLSLNRTSQAASPDFAAFERRAQAGERLNVVFFGASLTWGANASDPLRTSYRAVVAAKMKARYPRAHFEFFDAAIGGTDSRLGVFRLKRDVLSHRPDLVFLDFSANDGIYEADEDKLSSYESLVRRLIGEARAPVVQVFFPFKGDVARGNLNGMKRRDAHLEIARAYNTAVGDAIVLGQERVREKQVTLDQLWPIDGAHPGDVGYALFADAAFAAFLDGVRRDVVCRVPPQMLHDDTYMTNTRVRLSSLQPLPSGWRVGRPNRVSAYFDMLMSRWLDDEVIAAARDGSAPERLKLRFRGSTVLLLGESTPKSAKYRIYLDGKALEQNGQIEEFDAGRLGRRALGNAHHVQLLASGLDAEVEHTLEIEPIFAANETELRLESVCVAGRAAQVIVLF